MLEETGQASKASTLALQAFDRLRADIISAKLKPGAKMLVEHLREAYGVGAKPLREALSKLTSLELVNAEGQRGFRVAPVSIENLLDITKTRAWVEGAALRAAMDRGDRAWEAGIIAAAHRLRGCPKQDGEKLSDEWYRGNREFHDALVGACQSHQTTNFRAQLYDLSDRYRRLSVQHGLGGRDFDSEHQRIMDAVLTRNANAAITLTAEHFIETTRVILAGEGRGEDFVERAITELRRDIRSGLGL